MLLLLVRLHPQVFYLIDPLLNLFTIKKAIADLHMDVLFGPNKVRSLTALPFLFRALFLVRC